MSGILNVLCAGGQIISLTPWTVLDDAEASPTAASCSIEVERAGSVLTTGNGSDPNGDWAEPKHSTIGDIYEVRLTVSVGDAPTSGDLTATWLALTSDRVWAWNTGAGPGTKSATCTLEIRLASSGAVVTSTTLTVTAESVA